MDILFWKLHIILEQTLWDWKVKTFNIKNHERWMLLFLNIDKPFSHRWRAFSLIIGSFCLSVTNNFMDNDLANFTDARFWRIFQVPRKFVWKTFFLIISNYIGPYFLRFNILLEAGSFSVIFLAFSFILYRFLKFDFL